jgi:formylmethanofuran dehydrogenase subunit E
VSTPRANEATPGRGAVTRASGSAPAGSAAPDAHLIRGLIEASAALHTHACPRQVLGVRMGLFGAGVLGIPVPQVGKRLLVCAETDGCGADGIAVATNCWVGRRTMRIYDYGKLAATFVDRESERAVRVVPIPGAREAAVAAAPELPRREAMLAGYAHMPDAAMFAWSPVRLRANLVALWGQAGLRVACDDCGEEVMNGREVRRGRRVLCSACSGEVYYQPE